MRVSFLIVLINLFNILDAVFTTAFVMLGVATEANPIMAPLLAYNPALFIIIKTVIIVPLCTYLLQAFSYKLGAKLGLYILFVVYLLVCLYHLKFLIFYLAH